MGWAPAPAPFVPRGLGSFYSRPGLLGCYRGLPEWCQGAAGAVGAPHACSSSSCPWQLEQFKADNQDIGFGSGTRALEQALERTRANINWVKENKKTVLTWFQGEVAPS